MRPAGRCSAQLLPDEPLWNLDARLRARAGLVESRRRPGLTTLLVTHDREEANAAAGRMAVLTAGRVRQMGAAAELHDHPAARFVAGFLGSADMIRGEAAADGVRAGGVLLPLEGPAAHGRATLAAEEPHLRGLDPLPQGAPAGLATDPGQATLLRQ